MTVPRLALLTTLAALALPASAHAVVFGGDVIDGPSPNIVAMGDADMARDGTGAVTYVKNDGGVAHVFVSRFVDGAFQAPERIDGPSPGAASQPVVAASDGGRVVVAWVSGGQLQVALRPNKATAFLPPQAIADGGSNPSVDMSIFGVAYVSFTAPGASAADVRVARLARDGTGFQLLPDVLDIVPGRDAGNANGRSRIAVSADGTAVVVWGEAGIVYARRVFGLKVSAAPQILSVPVAAGHTGGTADLPDVSIEDDSSYAWATFRELFDDGHQHVVARRLVGSAFADPVFVDGFAYPANLDAFGAAIRLNGRGEGIAATAAGGIVNGAILHDDKFNPGTFLGAGFEQSQPAVGIAENNDSFAAWLPGDGSALMRMYHVSPAKRTVPPPGPATVLSGPAFGPVNPAEGMDLAVDRAGDAIAAFVQDGADGKRLVAGSFDRVPSAFRTYTTAKYRPFARPPLSWQAAFELWGPVTYTVQIDGKPVGTTTDTKLTTVNPVPDGVHTWNVIASDIRGQRATAPTRTLRVDSLPPALTFKVTGSRKQGKPVKVAVTAADGSLDAPSGSGIATVKIDFGDKTPVVSGRTATHRYAKNGTYTVRVSATDMAGNAVAQVLEITVKKK